MSGRWPPPGPGNLHPRMPRHPNQQSYNIQNSYSSNNFQRPRYPQNHGHSPQASRPYLVPNPVARVQGPPRLHPPPYMRPQLNNHPPTPNPAFRGPPPMILNMSEPPPGSQYNFRCLPPGRHEQVKKEQSNHEQGSPGNQNKESYSPGAQPPLPAEPPPAKPPPPPVPPQENFGQQMIPIFYPPWRQPTMVPPMVGMPPMVPRWMPPPQGFMRHRMPRFPLHRPWPPVKPNKQKRAAEEDVEPAPPKKKPMSKFYPSKAWNKNDAEKALAAELELSKKDARTLMLKFPERDITMDMVSSLHPAIEKVHFQVPGGARYCFVKVKDGVEADDVMDSLNKTDFFGMGNLHCEPKAEKVVTEEASNCDIIDPYTLYLGNLPINIPSSLLKEKFPTSQRIDIGFAQRMKFTRYAFIRYHTVEDAIDAFKTAVNLAFDSRTLVVRFRRQKANICPPATERKLSKKMLKEKRKMIQRQEQMEQLKTILVEKVKAEKISEGIPVNDVDIKAGLPDLLKSDVLFDGGQLSDPEHDEDEDEDIEDDEDDDDDDDINVDVSKLNGQLLPKEDELEDDEEDEEEDEDVEEEEEDDDKSDQLPLSDFQVKVEPPDEPVKIKIEKTIKQEDELERMAGLPERDDEEDYEEEVENDDDDDDE